VINTVSYVELLDLKDGTVGADVRVGGALDLPLPPLLQEILYVRFDIGELPHRFNKVAGPSQAFQLIYKNYNFAIQHESVNW
jgi:hypothetical protein